MTIKKPVQDSEAAETPAASAAGNVTIADRFKLDMPDPNARRGGSGKAAAVAVFAALVALAVAGFVTFLLYQHWEFLRAA